MKKKRIWKWKYLKKQFILAFEPFIESIEYSMSLRILTCNFIFCQIFAYAIALMIFKTGINYYIKVNKL